MFMPTFFLFFHELVNIPDELVALDVQLISLNAGRKKKEAIFCSHVEVYSLQKGDSSSKPTEGKKIFNFDLIGRKYYFSASNQ